MPRSSSCWRAPSCGPCDPRRRTLRRSTSPTRCWSRAGKTGIPSVRRCAPRTSVSRSAGGVPPTSPDAPSAGLGRSTPGVRRASSCWPSRGREVGAMAWPSCASGLRHRAMRPRSPWTCGSRPRPCAARLGPPSRARVASIRAAARHLREPAGLLGWQVGQRDRGAAQRRTATAALAQMVATSEEIHDLYRSSRRQGRQLARSQRQLDRLARETLRATDAERARIAHQIHDTAASTRCAASSPSGPAATVRR